MFAANSVQHQSSTGPTNFGGTIYGYADGNNYYSSSVTATFSSSGSVDATTTAAAITNTISGDTWYSPNTTGIGSSYWIKATVSSGSTPTGSSIGSWISLASDQSWSLDATNFSTLYQSNLLVQVSSSATGTPVVCSGTIILQTYKAIPI